MKRHALLLCTGALLWPALTGVVRASNSTAPDTPAAYAWSLPVTVTDDNGVHGLRLPSPVYLQAQSATLADLRLFDRRGLPVPYALRQPPTDTLTDARELPLRIFPLYRQPGAPASLTPQGDFKLELRTDSDGRLLSVTSAGAPSRPPPPGQAQGPTLETLILDLGVPARGTPPTVTALRFIPPAGKSGYSAQVWLEASDDLRDWRPLGAADLQWLSATDGAILACDVLAFEPARFRYARLTWRGGTPALFAGISALSVNQHQTAPAMDSAVLAPVPGRVPGDLVYTAGIGIPAERAGMRFATPNAVYAAMLGRYRDPPAPVWAEPPPPSQRRHRHLRDHFHRHERDYERRQANAATTPQPPPDPFSPIASATFYDITQDGKRKRSGGLTLPATQLAQWVVRPYSPQTAAMPLSQAPQLQLSWTPATLLFLATGNGPYTLAFGRAGASGMEHDLGHIAPGYTDKELRALPQAQAGTARPTVRAAPGGVLGGANNGAAASTAGAPAGGMARDGQSAHQPTNVGAPGTAGAAGSAGTIGTSGTSGVAANAAAAPRPGAAPALSWHRGQAINFSDHALLWGVLLAGVAGLAYLTVRLLKPPPANGS
ncbi:MAG: DUF3999 domain-containing protein [Burkholderiaceae bacterium]|nr:DUF3999 domain-containing protein [Burkholderiaceae bacterium]